MAPTGAGECVDGSHGYWGVHARLNGQGFPKSLFVVLVDAAKSRNPLVGPCFAEKILEPLLKLRRAVPRRIDIGDSDSLVGLG